LTASPYYADEYQHSKNVYALLMRVVDGKGESASVRAARRRIALPLAFDAWFRKATHPDASARYASVTAAYEALRTALSPSAKASAMRPARPRGWRLVAGSALLLIVSRPSGEFAKAPPIQSVAAVANELPTVSAAPVGGSVPVEALPEKMVSSVASAPRPLLRQRTAVPRPAPVKYVHDPLNSL
jgi:serine/threonine-protein kinase